MDRISVSTARARAAFRLAAGVSFLFTPLSACGPDGDRGDPPAMYLDPPSALQGASVVVNISAQGVAFDRCTNLQSEAFTFTNADNESQVTVYQATALGPDVMRATLVVAYSARVGTHAIEYQCDKNTLLRGNLQVRERLESSTVTLEPAEAPAGTYDLVITIHAEDTYFIEDVTHVIFGDGTNVAVKQLQLVGGTGELRVTVDISALSPVGEVDVAVITGSAVARGVFEITERIYPTIQVEPDQVLRPANGAVPVQASLHIEGESTTFVDPAEAEADEGTVVSFPDNPGVTIDMCDVNSFSEININISVDEFALLGPTPLVVETDGEVVTTDFTVLADPTDKVLLLTPSKLVRGEESALLVAKVVNSSFDSFSVAQFLDPECQVDAIAVLDAQTMALWTSVDSDFPTGETVLQIDTAAETVAAYVVIVDGDSPFVSVPAPQSVIQGYSGYVVLGIEGGLYSAGAHVHVLDRSGLKIENQSPAIDGTSIVLDIRVADDAPTGPSLLRVTDGSLQMETILNIVPSGAVPHMEIWPPVVLPGRRTVDVTATVTGAAMSASNAFITIDDPSVSVENVDVLDGGTAVMTLNVGPTARSDMAVAYLGVNGDKAAATYLPVGDIKPILIGSPDVITRGSTTATVLIQVNVSGYVFNSVVAQVFDGIGVEIERATVINANIIEIELEVEPTEPEGWHGGWFGIILTEADQQAVVPIKIAGTDQSLTMQISPDTVKPGDREVTISASVPPEASLSQAVTVADTGVPGVYATLDSLPSAGSADIVLDVAYDVQIGTMGIPIFLTAQKGAAVGHLDAQDLEDVAISEASPWEDDLLVGEDLLLTVDPGTPPTLFAVSSSKPAYADLEANLLYSQPLSFRHSFEDSDRAGVVWVLDSTDVKINVTPAGAPGAEPSSAWVVPKGGTAVDIVEPNDDPPDALQLAQSPCVTAFWAKGDIDGALDLDRVEIPATSCRLVCVVVARSVADRAWAVPDLRMDLLDSSDMLLDSSKGWPTDADADPRIYFDGDSAIRQIAVSAEQATAGFYMLNIRKPTLVREVCRVPGESFIELEVEPGQAMDSLSVVQLDPDTGALLAALPLSGTAPPDGLVVIGDGTLPFVDIDDTTGVALFTPGSGFVIALLDGVLRMDALQVGGFGNYGEGNSLANGNEECFSRFGGIDTDDNLFDFLASWEPTPGY